MSNLTSLKILELVDLMLENNDAKFLLDDICNNCYLKLKNLVIINTTKDIFPLIHPGVFLNLNILVISPQNLCDDLVHLLGFTSIQHLHIKSNSYSMATEACEPISYRIWEQTKKQNPTLGVHLEGMNEIFWQNGAPVKSLILNGNKKMIQADIVMQAIEQYDNSLEAFIFNGIPRFYRSKSFHDRADNSLMLLSHQCSNLSILVIHERISTATILLIASTLKNLKYLIVRRNAIIIKMDWPKRHNWSDDFYTWMKTNSKKYELVEREISIIMGYRWKMLTDKEFKNLKLTPYKSKLNSSIFDFTFN
ncbi:conserved hypothetical protein [Pediculus humanus corporis]|uniref:Uncharacterized protein n=1 Tax=Pediculus humanus subsp. corporis TaxID=121224 RepID=E0VAK5_PEDHC|nr:uncharacterized protein Phum_PHUM040250 [Pediculus humanus corporis]EEB10411.1 conserved hypothetical protein [Pediculus humanus corporis]